MTDTAAPAASGARRSRAARAGRLALIASAVLALLWLLAWLALPPLLKWQAEQRLSAMLGRSVTIGRVAIEPWALVLRVEQLRVARAGPGGGGPPQFEVAAASVDADWRSLFRLAPVLEAVSIAAPVLRLARLADGRYDIDDLLARLPRSDPGAPPGEPARFALYNLRLTDGAVEFDDRPVQRVHRLAALQIALPFLSNLPADVTVTVEPRLAFTLNDAAFDSGAQTRPFAQDRASEITLTVADLDLAPWLPYLPASLPLRPLRGRLASQLRVQFALAADGAPRVSMRGSASLADLALRGAADATPLVRWQRLDVALADVQPLARRVALGEVRLAGAQVDARRAADGRINLIPAAAAAPAPPASAAAGAWQLSASAVALTGARIDWHDATVRPAAGLRLDALDAQAGPLRWPLDAGVPFTLNARVQPIDGATDAAATLALQGQASDRAAQARVDLQGAELGWLAPYAAQALAARVQGRASVKAALDWNAGSGGDAVQLRLREIEARIDGVRVDEPGAAAPARTAKRPAALEVAALTLGGGALDLLAREARIGTLGIERPRLALVRDAQGVWNPARWLREPAGQPAAAAPPGPDWKLALDGFSLRGGEVRFTDRRPSSQAGATAVALLASGIDLGVDGFAWPGAATARTRLALRLAQADAPRGVEPARIAWNGQLTAAPRLALRGTLRAERVPVHAFEPYIEDGLNVSLLRARADWRGDISVAQLAHGWQARARGDALLADLSLHERSVADRGGDELLRWQSFALTGLVFEQTPGARPRLQIAQAALTDFYSRLVISEDGRFNLRDVAAVPAGAAASAPPPTPAASAPPATAASTLPLDIAIGGVRLTNGKIDFTDRFIRPNYSAALSELNGSLGAFDSTRREMAVLDLKGRAAGTALLEISGALNPTVQPLALDIRAKATDLELAPLSPYAGRYAGYAIERGKLSMQVAYKIDPDGKLDAKNQVVLNQLTFGDKVESPDATKLPVLLAVALLKDRHGVIDLDLPISGSINDPQFSVFGLVLKIIGNLLVKALTAPFALLGGGGSDDLSFIGFQAGTTRFDDAGKAALDKVAKALTDRPALRMTVTGAADPASEREAIQRAALDARLQAEQRRDALRSGAAADAPLPPLAGPTREALVRRLYADAKLPDKPRNLIGLAKEIPAVQMESMLLQATTVSTDSARELALQRGLAVRDALVAQGLPSERLFLAAPKLRASGEGDAAWSPRVQLALSTN